MTQRVHLERDGDVAVIMIDNPPVNAGSADVRRGLLDAIEAIAGDDAIVAAVLIGLARISGQGFQRGDVRHLMHDRGSCDVRH